MLFEIPEAIREQLVSIYNRLASQGKLLGEQAIREQQARFRERFGPEMLAGLDGEVLLESMHNHSNRDSLVYWLEFKNDDEFRTDYFGGIGGGSALNYKIYRRKETGAWMTGSPQHPKPISVDEAIAIARRHRDQLIQASRAVAELQAGASDEEYLALQHRLQEVAPDVSDTAWGHKYLTILHPDKLDDFHNPLWQRFYLIKLLQEPPPYPGRYVAAGRYVRLKAQFGWAMSDLTAVLKKHFGSPHRYWVFSLGTLTPQWRVMQERHVIALGLSALGDLSWLSPAKESIGILSDKISAAYPSLAQQVPTLARQIKRFVTAVSERDIVVVAHSERVLGIGRVTGGYIFSSEPDFPHCVPVEWLAEGDSLQQVNLSALGLAPVHETAVLSEVEIKNYRVLVEIERLCRVQPSRLGPEELTGVPKRIQEVLERKGQVILYGPPGTGKTYWAEWTARELAARHAFGKPFDDLDPVQKEEVVGSAEQGGGLVRMCCFHPAFGYEDFIEGYRPQTTNGQLSFTLQDGIFKRLCKDAAARPDRRFYLIIDEINRGDVPRIFGELLTVLERREHPIILPLSGNVLRVPKNVYVIGTMNTADRSIALLDTALRRRFGFIELMPDPELLGEAVVEGIPLGPWLAAINRRICEFIGHDARNLQIGHSYLMHGGRPITRWDSFVRALREDVLPLLQEYCYEDYATLEKILGNRLVDASDQRFREELFQPEHKQDLIEALRAAVPEILTLPQTMQAEAELSQEDEGSGADSGTQ